MIIFVPNKTACKTFDDKKVCQKCNIQYFHLTRNKFY